MLQDKINQLWTIKMNPFTDGINDITVPKCARNTNAYLFKMRYPWHSTRRSFYWKTLSTWMFEIAYTQIAIWHHSIDELIDELKEKYREEIGSAIFHRELTPIEARYLYYAYAMQIEKLLKIVYNTPRTLETQERKDTAEKEI